MKRSGLNVPPISLQISVKRASALAWLKFLLCVGIILFAGTKLVRYGDAIAEKTGLGRIWIGLVLITTVITMPELITGVSSVPWKNTSHFAELGVFYYFTGAG